LLHDTFIQFFMFLSYIYAVSTRAKPVLLF
jgi:hypothetical protein